MRRASLEGGVVTVLAKGDATAGAILIVAQERGKDPRLLERGIGPDGHIALISTGPAGESREVTDYWIRRRDSDPDLWVVEVDIAAAERFVAETILTD